MSADLCVLFVCVHNAARSRMTEALLRQLGGPRFEVTSAGFEPREVNPLVVEALADVGLSLPATAAQPSVFDLFKAGRHFHYVIGVCEVEHGQRCPLPPASRSASMGASRTLRRSRARTTRGSPVCSRCVRRFGLGSSPGSRRFPTGSTPRTTTRN